MHVSKNAAKFSPRRFLTVTARRWTPGARVLTPTYRCLWSFAKVPWALLAPQAQISPSASCQTYPSIDHFEFQYSSRSFQRIQT
ncbi:hypothetical protein BOTBODRAFT_552043 [Botryobasidium botryosum FD-172 SS1]|uniref:Uncharacterized protein n=1 Tax=Botryobasidium botryosum (strain FD-172 SS1) TaxID=930990 RepID=A0A067N1X7_BOTB1|nr:hypothetical protein BOTBODRAFT_552043 [Botryobasidium botryosum FD-172 SS1]